MATHKHYPATFKQHVLCEYQPNTREHSFRALAKKYAIPKHTTIASWYRQWDGTVASLQIQPSEGRKRTLTQAESTTLILKPVNKALEKKQKINYKEIHTDIIANPDYRHISLSTVKRLGKRDHRLKWKRTEQSLTSEGICNYKHSRGLRLFSLSEK